MNPARKSVQKEFEKMIFQLTDKEEQRKARHANQVKRRTEEKKLDTGL